MHVDPADAPGFTSGRVRELTRERCFALLTTTTVGRVAFVDGDGQQLVPVNFILLDGSIYFRTRPGGFLAQLATGEHHVAFGVDHHEDTFQVGWNVTVQGVASGVEDGAVVDRVLGQSRLHPWAGGIRPLVVRVTTDAISGRHVSGH